MHRTTLATFADLFSYPWGDVAATAQRCFDQTGEPALLRFAAWLRRASDLEIERAYTATFDRNPTCVPSLAHHLRVERRASFLSRLAEMYEREGFRPREERGDHIADVLRFLAYARDEHARNEVIRDGLNPALQSMAQALRGNPYEVVLESLRAQLGESDAAHP